MHNNEEIILIYVAAISFAFFLSAAIYITFFIN